MQIKEGQEYEEDDSGEPSYSDENYCENASTIFDQDPQLTKRTEASVFDKYYEGIDL